MHKRFPAPITFLFVCFFLLTGARGAEAKSVSWTSSIMPNLAYYWNHGTGGSWSGEGVTPETAGCAGGTLSCGWATALQGASAAIIYKARIIDVATSTEIFEGSVIPVGTQIRFEQIVPQDEDISWFGTGFTSDSPYGHWVNNAGPRRDIGCSWEESSFFDTSAEGYSSYAYAFHLLNINPPVVTYSHIGTTLSCDASGQNCTVMSSGPIMAQVNIESTYGKFYHRYRWYEDGVDITGCTGNNVPLRVAPGSWDEYRVCEGFNCVSGPDYILPIPSQTITFNLTAVGGNAAPAAPVITPQPFTGPTSIAHTFSAQASDPEGDQIRYAFDWDNNGSVDAYIPPIGYVASNTLQSTQNPISGQWTLPGTASFKVRTEDNQGGISPWTGATATLFPVVNGLCGPASGIATSTSPTIGLCTSGTATAVSGSGPFTWGCLGSQGGTDDLSCSAPYVAPPTLKICENACDSTLDRTGQTFAMNQSSTKTLKACFNAAVSCANPTGDVTATATWTEANIPQNVITLSNGTLTSALATGQENFQVSYGGSTKTATIQVACVPLTCLAAKAQTDAYCSDTIQDTGVSNGCGSTLVCPGTRFCDTNYREVAP